MELTSAGSMGTQGTAASGASIAATLSVGAAIGEFVCVRVGCSNQSSSGGNTNFHQTLADTKGNTWTKGYEWSREQPGGGDIGRTVSLWYTVVTVAMVPTDVVTCTFDGAELGRQIAVNRYTTEQAIALIEIAAVGGAGGQHTSSATTLSVTTDAVDIEEWEWFGAGHHNSNAAFGLGLTLDANWVTDRSVIAVTNGFEDSGSLWGQKRTLAIDELTWSIAKGAGSGRWALVLIAFRVTPEDPPPSEAGTREFQSDFDTAGHVVSGTSIANRRDAISPDYQTRECLGPVAIGDDSLGLEAHRWQVRADGASIYLRRSNLTNTEWEDETLFGVVPGSVPVTQIDMAFTADAALVLAAEVPTGTGGAPNITLYRYSEWINMGPGMSPCLINDLFPFVVAEHICPPANDVQLFYNKTGAGIKRRDSVDDFNTDYDTPLGWSTNRRVEEAFKTTDRRVGIVVSRRIPSTGRYVLEPLHSTPYTDALLHRPTFLPWSSPSLDLFQSGESGWYSPFPGTETNNWNLRVGTTDACDAIEVAASGGIPLGSLPAFDQQEQESGAKSAGGFHDFQFSITHGGYSMSLRSFRARIRRTVGEITCYSPWRYMVLPAANLRSSPADTSVNCDRDIILDLPYRQVWIEQGVVEGIRDTPASARGDNWPLPCSDGPAYSESSTNPGGPFSGWWFVGGVRNTTGSFPFPTHFVPYSIRRRPTVGYNFVDEDAVHHNGVVIGAALNGGGSGAPFKVFDWPANRFPSQFPDDNGLAPTVPVTLDIIG